MEVRLENVIFLVVALSIAKSLALELWRFSLTSAFEIRVRNSNKFVEGR